MPDDTRENLVRSLERARPPGPGDSKPTRLGSSGGQPLLAKTHRVRPRPPFECVALVLQGGGALGAYQAGVYQALAEADLHPAWVAGISIGAINAAIIAGNAPGTGVEMLRRFWESITAAPPGLWWNRWLSDLARGEMARSLLNQMHAFSAVTGGVAGFCGLRVPPPWLQPAGSLEATSFYVTEPLRTSLEGSVSTRAKPDGLRCTASPAYAVSRMASAAVARRR